MTYDLSHIDLSDDGLQGLWIKYGSIIGDEEGMALVAEVRRLRSSLATAEDRIRVVEAERDEARETLRNAGADIVSLRERVHGGVDYAIALSRLLESLNRAEVPEFTETAPYHSTMAKAVGERMRDGVARLREDNGRLAEERDAARAEAASMADHLAVVASLRDIEQCAAREYGYGSKEHGAAQMNLLVAVADACRAGTKERG